ncbi:NUDIX domain-containing protein [Amycolatopsis sp. lyj-108]|uniref:NUDIX domain-containing protein n=1 Tax=Amycolatopsis sp. lyj-108 TaxID=2789286 RepID=UPI00397AB059
MLFDDRGRILIVEPTYKPGWGLPGGVIEEGESPLAACVRELREELGIAPVLGPLAGVDWIPPRSGRDDSNVFVFAGRIPDEMIPAIRLPADELSACQFVDRLRFRELMAPHIARRIEVCRRAHDAGRVAYLEFGCEVMPAPSDPR